MYGTVDFYAFFHTWMKGNKKRIMSTSCPFSRLLTVFCHMPPKCFSVCLLFFKPSVFILPGSWCSIPPSPLYFLHTHFRGSRQPLNRSVPNLRCFPYDLWPWYSADLVLSQNVPSLPGYKCCCFYCSRLTGSIPALPFYFLTYPLIFQRWKRVFCRHR